MRAAVCTSGFRSSASRTRSGKWISEVGRSSATAPRGAENSARKMKLNGRARVFITSLLRRVCCGCKLLGRLISFVWNSERTAGRGLMPGIRLRTEHAARMVAFSAKWRTSDQEGADQDLDRPVSGWRGRCSKGEICRQLRGEKIGDRQNREVSRTGVRHRDSSLPELRGRLAAGADSHVAAEGALRADTRGLAIIPLALAATRGVSPAIDTAEIGCSPDGGGVRKKHEREDHGR